MSKLRKKEPWKDPRVRKQVIQDYVANRIDRKAASIKLHTSTTYISTRKKKYLDIEDKAFTHGNARHSSPTRASDSVEEDLRKLYETIYYDFSFQHFCERTRQSGELAVIAGSKPVSDRTIARILVRNGLRSPKSNKTPKGSKTIHPLGPRRAKFGELVQLDASIHDWFSDGAKWALYTAIDDTTSIILVYYC